jgi:hypothetical protein
MISYADFDFAITRWKARAAGAPQPVPSIASGTVAAEVPVATAPEDPSIPESGIVEGSAEAPASGDIPLSDPSLEAPNPESEPR